MILVNISAVATSTTLTLMPVSSSHFGPEKFSGIERLQTGLPDDGDRRAGILLGLLDGAFGGGFGQRRLGQTDGHRGRGKPTQLDW